MSPDTGRRVPDPDRPYGSGSASGADRYLQWDAAYVLGALSPAERHEFEDHLAGCPDCRAAVTELAAMPGLLSQLPDGDIDMEAEPPPPTLLDAVARRRATRPARTLLLAAAAALILVLGGLAGFALRGVAQQATPANASSRLAFSPVVPSSMTAVVDVVPVPSGTELRVECQYGIASPGSSSWAYAEYAIYLVDRQGHAEEAKTWTAKPNKVMHPVATTRLKRSQISAVEIRLVDGPTLMRARLG
ncbi:anti-sigma-L factor RslA [Microlunatus panaciterrae]|uniref:Putative zinc-finger domain-containing protein n=1 Tax=Microlunatus panaciterrae TaxID=400768 RepID=A0ABS2RJV0_9ACTN|nr:zf-HC2 domain-containing protein [Microlunatus panaciterrae]MBM7799280.1 hypothetical protein [Microlunatus panaciterrae]